VWRAEEGKAVDFPETVTIGSRGARGQNGSDPNYGASMENRGRGGGETTALLQRHSSWARVARTRWQKKVKKEKGTV